MLHLRARGLAPLTSFLALLGIIRLLGVDYASHTELRTGSLLARLHANKAELLIVLDRPQTPLNTNGSENDIQCQVTRRKVSAGTRSDLGRDCRDAFLGLTKTCTKLGVPVWDYLGSRLRVPGQRAIPPLPALVRCRGQPA